MEHYGRFRRFFQLRWIFFSSRRSANRGLPSIQHESKYGLSRRLRMLIHQLLEQLAENLTASSLFRPGIGFDALHGFTNRNVRLVSVAGNVTIH